MLSIDGRGTGFAPATEKDDKMMIGSLFIID